MIAYSSPLMGGLIFNAVATRSDILLLGFWASVEEVGIYSAAFQTSAIMAVILGVFESIATPFLSESIARGDREQIRSLAATVSRWTLTATFPLFLIMSMSAKEIMALFGEGFEAGSSCLIILVVGQIVQSAMGCSNGLLMWAGHSRLVMWNNLVVSTIQVGLYLLLIPAYGIVGAAVGTCASLILIVIMRIVQVHQILDLWAHDRDTLKPLVSGLAAFLVVEIARGVSMWSQVLVMIGFFLLIYVSSLYMMGLHEGDREVLIRFKQRLGQMV